MSSAAEIPQRDEALKSLVTRFKEAPGSGAFVELAAALLARGHASESLRIAEHGLQLVPGSADGRVERAAALLALGRPRVAYVELLRALAIHPNHKRGMRLLGRAFVDAGAPGRAAALLAKRSGRQAAAPAGGTFQDRPHIDEIPVNPPVMPAVRSGEDVPALFSALTKDLGLGSAALPQRVPPRRVEVTQIIRRKALPRPPRSASELAEIEGPIVDTTQPGQIHDLTLEDEPADAVVTTREPAPLWNGQASNLANFALDDFALDDEPLFQEHMPFEVRPVAGPYNELSDDLPNLSGDLDQGDTVVDDIEDAAGPLEPISTPSGPSPMHLGPPPLNSGSPRPTTSDLELPAGPRRPAMEVPQRSPAVNPRAPTALLPPMDGGSRSGPDFEGVPQGAVIEKSRRREPGLELVTPKVPPARVAIAVATALAMLLYVVGLVWLGSDRLSVWLDPAKESAAAPPAVDSDGAQAQRP